MSNNLFNLVAEFSGQRNNISIPRIYIRLCQGDFFMAAVLNQLVFWSSKVQRADGFFWKSYEELANELCEEQITVEQVRYAVKKIRSLLADCLTVQVRKANGTPTNHYRFDQLRFLQHLQPLAETQSSIGSARKGNNPPLRTENSQGEDRNFTLSGSRNFTGSLTDPNHIQTTDPYPPNPQGNSAHAETQAVGSDHNFVKPTARKPKTPPLVDYSTVAQLYNDSVEQTGVPMPKIRNPNNLTDARKKAIKSVATFFLKEWGQVSEQSFRDYFMDFIEQAKKRPDQFYFGGGSRGWVANFDYVMTTRIATKTLENTL